MEVLKQRPDDHLLIMVDSRRGVGEKIPNDFDILMFSNSLSIQKMKLSDESHWILSHPMAAQVNHAPQETLSSDSQQCKSQRPNEKDNFGCLPSF